MAGLGVWELLREINLQRASQGSMEVLGTSQMQAVHVVGAELSHMDLGQACEAWVTGAIRKLQIVSAQITFWFTACTQGKSSGDARTVFKFRSPLR